MYDGLSIAQLSRGVIKALSRVVLAVRDVQNARACAGGNWEALLNIALIKVKRWHNLWCTRAIEDAEAGADEDNLLASLWGSAVLNDVRRLLGIMQRDADSIDKAIVDANAYSMPRLSTWGRSCRQAAKGRGFCPVLPIPNTATQVLQEVNNLCTCAQSLEPLTEAAFRRCSRPAKSVDSARADNKEWYRELTSKRRGLFQFVDFCNTTERSVDVRLSASENNAGDPGPFGAPLRNVLLICQCDVPASATESIYFEVCQVHTGMSEDQALGPCADSETCQLMERMQSAHDSGGETKTTYHAPPVRTERDFVLQEWQLPPGDGRSGQGCQHTSREYVQLPTIERTDPLSTAEKFGIACSLAHHALMLLGSRWASTFTAPNLRRQGCPESRLWKLHVQDDMVDTVASKQSVVNVNVMRAQIVEFGVLLLALAAGSDVVSSFSGPVELARDVLPKVKRDMGVRYSNACLFCLNAPSMDLAFDDAYATKTAAAILTAFYTEVCLP